MARCRNFSRKRADRLLQNIAEGLPLGLALEELTSADVENWCRRNPTFKAQFDAVRFDQAATAVLGLKRMAGKNHEAASNYHLLLSQEAMLAHLNGMTSEPA